MALPSPFSAHGIAICNVTLCLYGPYTRVANYSRQSVCIGMTSLDCHKNSVRWLHNICIFKTKSEPERGPSCPKGSQLGCIGWLTYQGAITGTPTDNQLLNFPHRELDFRCYTSSPKATSTP